MTRGHFVGFGRGCVVVLSSLACADCGQRGFLLWDEGVKWWAAEVSVAWCVRVLLLPGGGVEDGGEVIGGWGFGGSSHLLAADGGRCHCR